MKLNDLRRIRYNFLRRLQDDHLRRTRQVGVSRYGDVNECFFRDFSRVCFVSGVVDNDSYDCRYLNAVANVSAVVRGSHRIVILRFLCSLLGRGEQMLHTILVERRSNDQFNRRCPVRSYNLRYRAMAGGRVQAFLRRQVNHFQVSVGGRRSFERIVRASYR